MCVKLHNILKYIMYPQEQGSRQQRKRNSDKNNLETTTESMRNSFLETEGWKT